MLLKLFQKINLSVIPLGKTLGLKQFWNNRVCVFMLLVCVLVNERGVLKKTLIVYLNNKIRSLY